MRCNTASITSRYLACVPNADVQRRTALPRPELWTLRRAPAAVKMWRYSVAGAVRVSMDECFERLARGAGGEVLAVRSAARSRSRDSAQISSRICWRTLPASLRDPGWWRCGDDERQQTAMQGAILSSEGWMRHKLDQTGQAARPSAQVAAR